MGTVLATAMVPLAMLLTLRARDTLSVASFTLALWTVACAATQPLWAWSARHHEGRMLVALSLATAVAQLSLAADPGQAPCSRWPSSRVRRCHQSPHSHAPR